MPLPYYFKERKEDYMKRKVRVKGPGVKLNNVWRYINEEAIIDEAQYEENKEHVEVIEEIEENTNIDKITLRVKKSNEEIQKEENQKQNDIQQKLVKEVQKIKKVQIGENKTENKNEDENLSAQDISNIKSFLIKEYEVNEKCLKIN